MQKTVRERVALLIFFVLVFAGASILMSYFSTGRNWSVAATAVDDRVGQMEGYTAIVYSGVADKPSTSLNKDLTAQSVSEQTSVNLADQNIDADKKTGLGLRLLTLATEVDSAADGCVFVSDVRNIYEKRGAEVLSLDLSDNASRYAVPQLFQVGSKKIGVFALKERLSRLEIASIVGSLKRQGASNIVCIAPRPALISTYDGIDVSIIIEGSHQYSVQNTPYDNTVIAQSPSRGNVGVVLFTSNNIPSAKTVESL